MEERGDTATAAECRWSPSVMINTIVRACGAAIKALCSLRPAFASRATVLHSEERRLRPVSQLQPGPRPPATPAWRRGPSRLSQVISVETDRVQPQPRRGAGLGGAPAWQAALQRHALHLPPQGLQPSALLRAGCKGQVFLKDLQVPGAREQDRAGPPCP